MGARTRVNVLGVRDVVEVLGGVTADEGEVEESWMGKRTRRTETAAVIERSAGMRRLRRGGEVEAWVVCVLLEKR